MLKYAVKRFLSMIPTLFVVMTLTFVLVRLVPGGPFDSERKVPDSVRQNQEKKYRLNDPLYKQYLDYMARMVRLDLGESFHYPDRTVMEIIGDGFPVSLSLGLFSMLLALAGGLLAGTVSALKKNTAVDYGIMATFNLGIAMPLFLIVTLLILLLARVLHWVPVGGFGRPSQMVIPVLSLAFPYMAYITRLTKAGLLENLRKDYVTAARARGLSKAEVLFRHVLKGSLIPVVTYIGPAFAGIVTGSMVVEQICGIPGMGKDFIQAAFNRDYFLICGVVLVYVVLLLAMNFLVDLAYGWLDPRVRDGQGAL